MESSVLTDVFLPVALAVIMLGMGLSLTIADFKRVAIFPKAIFTGLFCQMILLPAIAFGLLYVFPMQPELAVGLIILAASPGGATSNLITHLSHGDTALSITLTAINSIIIVFSLPLIVNFGMAHFMDEGQYVPLNVVGTAIGVVVVTLVPVVIGMIVKRYKPVVAKKADRPVRILSAVFLALIILAALLKERDKVIDYFISSGPATFALNLIMLGLGFGIARMMMLSKKQSLTISIESGLQNGTLGIAVAATLLKNPTMTIPSAIYSLIMFGTATIIILLANRFKKGFA